MKENRKLHANYYVRYGVREAMKSEKYRELNGARKALEGIKIVFEVFFDRVY